MHEWHRRVQTIVEGIDRCIENRDDDALTLSAIACASGYSEFHMTRKFKELTGVCLRDYLRGRRLAFALIDVRDTCRTMLEIAVDYGFSSHEAFCRAFKAAYGVTPGAYRAKPMPVVLRTRLYTFDRYFFGLGEIGMVKSTEEVKVYFVSIPAHKFLHIKNYESEDYFSFWERQDAVPGCGCDEICGLLDSVKGKLDGDDKVTGKFDGQIMARIFEGDRIALAYGARLPADYRGEVPARMLMMDVAEGEYVVFEHGAFDYEQERDTVSDKVQAAMDEFDYDAAGYQKDGAKGRVGYLYFNPERYLKRVVPVKHK